KDMIIRRGVNLYPDDIEQSVAQVPGLRKGCIVAFGSPDPHSGSERLIVIAESHVTDSAERKRLAQAVNAAIVDRIGEPPDDVVIAPPRTILKTSSGKLRRAATRAAYEHGTLAPRHLSTARTALRLAMLDLVGRARQMRDRALHIGRGIYVWSLAAIAALPIWLAGVVPPSAGARWQGVRLFARVMLRLWGVRVVPHPAGPVSLPAGSIVVGNHASYLDACVLVSLIRQPLRFVAKAELARYAIIRIFLRRLGAEFVERGSASASQRDVEQLACSTDQRPLFIFPEGTFGRAAGLRPFHLGAFEIAVRRGAIVLPLALRGVRAILRDGEWVPRRGTVHVLLGEPLAPAATAPDPFQAAVQLRDAARGFIAQHCGEPVLDL
ncbi:MAG: 1-acyl-sn-glycerol-3-phosphate acyltransferase, partial [Steroidobacteraceae bacterium]|nr:1-acyl-sn-glycerol-3-phosphate acyltransferase [Steroidobacteraceae bacterium]